MVSPRVHWHCSGSETRAPPPVMQAAVDCAKAPVPAVRTWTEVKTVAMTHALAGNWRLAFDAVEQPADERAGPRFAASFVDPWQRLIRMRRAPGTAGHSD